MGMSATQARYLSLVAQQTNLEYQGQQINQERSVLAQQVSDLYNSLLNLQVPTPPNTQEFTRVVYKCNILGDNLSFSPTDVTPGKNKTYNITFNERTYSAVLSLNPGTITTEKNDGIINGTKVTGSKILLPYTADGNGYEASTDTSISQPPTVTATDTYMHETSFSTTDPLDPGIHFIKVNIDSTDENAGQEDWEFLPATPENISKHTYSGPIYECISGNTSSYTYGSDYVVTAGVETMQQQYLKNNSLVGLFVVNLDGTVTPATESDVDVDQDGNFRLALGKEYFYEDNSGTDQATNTAIGPNNGEYLIAGQEAYSLDNAKVAYGWTDEQLNNYKLAVTNSNLCAADGTSYSPDDFYVYKDSEGTLHFALKIDVNTNDGATTTYDFNPNGEVIKKTEYKDCLLEFDPSSGRILSLSRPVSYNGDEVESYSKVTLEAVTETDEIGYKNAMAQYEYAQLLYDQEQTNINAKTEEIQQMDRNLELKLQRLDTQRTQITTELDALDKVLKDNIEKSYKTFSG